MQVDISFPSTAVITVIHQSYCIVLYCIVYVAQLYPGDTVMTQEETDGWTFLEDITSSSPVTNILIKTYCAQLKGLNQIR